MTWNALVEAVTSQYPSVRPGTTFGMPCLKGADGRVIACLTRDGGIDVKLPDEQTRTAALKLSGARTATHAFDPRRPMKQWVHLPAAEPRPWLDAVKRGLETR